MATEGGRSRPDQERALALLPCSEDFPIARQVEPEARAKYLEFSAPAKAAFEELVVDYANQLINAAFTAKENVKGDNVSEDNVREASYSVNRKKEKGLTKLAGILGGTFLGTSLSTLFTAIQTNTFDLKGTIIIAVSGILGAFLIALDLTLPHWPRRRPSLSPPLGK